MVDRYSGFVNARDWARKNGFDEIKKQDFYFGYYKVVYRPGEKFEHFMAKAAIVFHLAKMERPVASELRLQKNGKDKRFLDVFDASECNHIGVEDTSPEKDADFVVKVHELPVSVRKGLAELEQKIKELIP